jgi:endothelin-converting enzyme/putative endopeptidase
MHKKIRKRSGGSSRLSRRGAGGVGLSMALGIGLAFLGAAHGKKAPTDKPAAPAGKADLGIDVTALDRSVKPCDDFFRFACGGWLARTEIPADRPTWSRGFSDIHERNQTTLRAILEEQTTQAQPGSPARKLTDFYGACMNEARVDAKSKEELAEALKPIDAIKNLDDLAKEVARVHQGYGNAFFGLSSQQDFKDATKVIGGIDQSGLGLPDRDYYLKTDEKSVEIQKEYLAHAERMMTLAGVPSATAKQQAQTIYAIEKQLATGSLDRVARRDPKSLYHREELAGVLKRAPKFPWQTYLTALGVGGLREINIVAPAFLDEFNKVLTTQSIDNLKIYLRWHVIHGVAGRLSKPFVEENFAFYSKRLTGTAEILPRWKRCITATEGALGEALAARYVEKTFGADGKVQAEQIIQDIEAAMSDSIKGLRWMDDATRTAALTKLSKIANKIGYPDKARDYSALTISADSYLKNVVAANGFETRRDLKKIGQPLDRTEWLMTAPTVNAYYEPLLNEIVFPAGILQPPMFSKAAVRAVNYGGIGMVMGHEVTHGFDDEGRQFDADGNLRDWWSKSVGDDFVAKASCVEKQYSEYSPLDGVKLDGKLTLGENIADLGGIKLAYQALKLANKRQPQPLPKGSTFTEDQLFFLGAAQSWCDKRRDEYARMLAKIDPHSPPAFRINGPLSNLPEFAKAFQCKAGSKMVRAGKEQCAIW